MDMAVYAQALINGVMLGVIYVIVALGLTLVFGMMHIVNLAHGEIYMVGAFVLWTFMVALGINYFAALLVTMLVLFILGALLELILFARFPGRAGLFKSMIVCLGLGAILPNSVSLIYNPFSKNIPMVFKGEQQFLGLHLPNERLMVILFSVVLVGLLFLFLKRTMTGQAMIAVEQDVDAAQLTGVSVSRVRLWCLGIGCALAGGAASFVAPVLGASPWMGEPMIMNSFAIIIIGGMGSLPGAVLGGLILGLAQSFGSLWVNPPTVNMLVFLLIILILLIKPTGLLGHA